MKHAMLFAKLSLELFQYFYELNNVINGKMIMI